jgi:hypothetical protein
VAAAVRRRLLRFCADGTIVDLILLAGALITLWQLATKYGLIHFRATVLIGAPLSAAVVGAAVYQR